MNTTSNPGGPRLERCHRPNAESVKNPALICFSVLLLNSSRHASLLGHMSPEQGNSRRSEFGESSVRSRPDELPMLASPLRRRSGTFYVCMLDEMAFPKQRDTIQVDDPCVEVPPLKGGWAVRDATTNPVHIHPAMCKSTDPPPLVSLNWYQHKV
jgi:hypothetical protein